MATGRKSRLTGGSGLGIAVLLTVAAAVPLPEAHAVAQPDNSGAVALSKSPVPADASWQSYVESDGAPTVKPAAVVSTSGAVTGAQALVNGTGTVTLTDVAGQAPPTIVLDYGKEVGGLPFFNVSSASPASPATSVTLRSGYSEARQYLFGAAPSTALAAPAAAGATNVSVNSVTGFYAGGHRRLVPVERAGFHKFRTDRHDPRPQGFHTYRGAAGQYDGRGSASQRR